MAIKEIGQSATEVGFQADPGLIKNADGETVIAVTADERVGIGTDSPGSTLEVKDGHKTATDADVTHGVTNVAATNAYGDIGPIHATYGGLMINCISDRESARPIASVARDFQRHTHGHGATRGNHRSEAKRDKRPSVGRRGNRFDGREPYKHEDGGFRVRQRWHWNGYALGSVGNSVRCDKRSPAGVIRHDFADAI